MKPSTAIKLNMAKHACRTHRTDGTAQRFVYLWDSKDYNTAKCLGRVDPKTMEAVTRLGLWDHCWTPQRDGCDTFEEHWWKWDETCIAKTGT